MGFIRLVIFGFIGLSVIYVLLSIYSRSIRREKLEDEWAEEHGERDSPEHDAFVEKGIAEYNNSLRPKLLLLVYVVPAVLVAVALYLTNSN
ncbi:hypothetical protein RXV86_18185 [Alisedimentitalea sp. MJ-SS2]|uniref:hypothetical protein n=1 Tax=Aliisedimentitalea sp. MJ-SS2 TaxID=3049795 RepID=UPI00290D7705|nr:hypothetical protein [Alisedimentitalea sp. MJ-SS2]MDU8929326.1 hypothetical protein [Alisedimentitalea sp. MJ-SS2]